MAHNSQESPPITKLKLISLLAILHYKSRPNSPSLTLTIIKTQNIEDGRNWCSNLCGMWNEEQPLPVQGGGADTGVRGICSGCGG